MKLIHMKTKYFIKTSKAKDMILYNHGENYEEYHHPSLLETQ